jgi:hypothetical protein
MGSYVDQDAFDVPDPTAPLRAPAIEHRPRILLLYVSLRERSFSRFDLEAISAMSCEATPFSKTDDLPARAKVKL